MSGFDRDLNDAELGKFDTFREIIRRLRAEGGCPWDRKQTHESLRRYLVEESYEVLDSIDDRDMESLKEELGDLWLQIMLHAQIAEEEGQFTIEDVLRRIGRKLISRHPHVFGGAEAGSAEEVSLNWDELKGQEKGEGRSVLAGIPRQLPALSYSESLQRRAASVGFDWRSPEDIMEKLVEEVDELKKAPNQNAKECEFGDVLFTLANVARRMDIDLEASLRQANSRFAKRFRYMEEESRRKGTDLKSLTLAEMDRLWDEAKTRD